VVGEISSQFSVFGFLALLDFASRLFSCLP
jgi:hypothetical protein